MNPEQSLETALALLIVQRTLSRAFEQLTGMTLDEWDEQNYLRIMGYDCPA